MYKTVKLVSNFDNLQRSKGLLFVSLLLMAVLFSSPFISMANGLLVFDVTVKNEAELRKAICRAPDNTSRSICIGGTGTIVLEKPLEIPERKVISLCYGRLVGRDGMAVIIVKSGGKLVLFGGTVTHADGATGRGVYVESGGEFTLCGVISDNTADYGGGVYNAGIFTLLCADQAFEDNYGGVISDNTADYGGGVYNVGAFTIRQDNIPPPDWFSNVVGEISNNVATKGGGVYNAGTFDVYDDALIFSNVATSGEGADVFIGEDVFIKP
jgi:hypothetical protein